MASSALQKLFRIPKISPTLLTSLHNNTKPLSNPTSIISPIITVNPPQHSIHPTSENTPQDTVFFPSFPFGYFPNPISSSGSDSNSEIENDLTVWADSVKKKRKRKMNKHKYKKLRKRMRGH